MSVLRDLTGQRFGRLTVLCRDDDHIQENGRHRIMWKCLCDCGNEVIVFGENLKKGASRSCGCLQKEEASERHSTHHQTDTKLYGIWCAMKARCYNKNTKYYYRYGGRGICICDEWKNSFEAFHDWAVLAGYKQGLSIDRINNNAGYSPENCRWADAKTQANNRCNNRILTHQGETKTLTEWAVASHVNPKTLFSRAYSGYSDAEILSE